MRIAVLNAEFHPVPPAQGGPIAQTIYETALAYPQGQMVVVSPWTDSLKGWAFDQELFRHVTIEGSSEHTTRDGVTGLDGRAGSYLRAASDIIDTFSPDLIQVHNAPHFLPYLFARFPEAKHVLFARNPLGCDQTELNAIDHYTDCVVFVSDFLRQQFLDAFPDARVRTEVIYNAVDTDRFSADRYTEPQVAKFRRTYDLPKASTLLFSGRILEQKGLEPLIRAIMRIRKHVPRARLLVAGTPAYKGEHDASDLFMRDMRQLASNQKDAIRFIGYVEPEKMPWLYAAATITVVPSLWGEPFGKVAIESMATSVPVVASRRGGLPEIITDNQDGILVDHPEDDAELANAITGLLTDTKRQQRIAGGGIETVNSRFSNEVRQKTIRSFYKTMPSMLRKSGETIAHQHPHAQDLQHKLLSVSANGASAL